jgi:hypothetical protein
MVVDRPARLGRPINHSVGHDIHIGLLYLTCHTSLLSQLFISLRIIVIQSPMGIPNSGSNSTDTAANDLRKWKFEQ